MNNSSLLRKVLIAIILLVSLSSAFLYFSFTSGMYAHEEIEYKSVFIKNGTLFSGLNEAEIKTNILIRAESISCIGSDCEAPEDAWLIDAEGMYIMPAFMDLGVQFYRASGEDRELSSFQQFFSFTRQRPEVRKNFHRAGITSIRSVGDAPQNILVLREQLASGKLAGPRIYAAGLMLSIEGAYPLASEYQGNEFMLENGVRSLTGPNELQEAVEELNNLEVDGFKLVFKSFGGKYPIMEAGILEAALKKADERNIWASVLTGNNEELKTAVNAGAKLIEGGSLAKLDTSLVQLLKAQEVSYLPMLSSLEEEEKLLNQQIENVKRLYEAGVSIGLATDNKAYQSFGKSIQREMELLVEAGIPASEVIKAASLGAAIAIKVDDRLGSIEEGKLADILISSGKAWEDISQIKKLQYVIQEGKVIMDKGELIN
ncbi:MAG: amidohydrolase family protein [Bacteroidia bacterium]|nr:amidohydrolase family protein [Bacteroidia bacterium]